MPFANIQEVIDRAIFQARVLSDLPPEDDPVIAADVEAEVWLQQVLADIAAEVASDPERNHLLTGTVTVTITDGQGDLPEHMLSEYIDYYSVLDGAGNVLVRVHKRDEYLRSPKPKVYGYYNLYNGKIWMQQIATGDMQADGTIQLTGIVVPTPVTITDIPDELTHEVVMGLAKRIRFGVLAPVRAPK